MITFIITIIVSVNLIIIVSKGNQRRVWLDVILTFNLFQMQGKSREEGKLCRSHLLCDHDCIDIYSF